MAVEGCSSALEEFRRATHVVRVELVVTPLRDCVVPPFTSKVVKTALELGLPDGFLRGLFESRLAYKPFSLSPLYDGPRPLYKVEGEPGVLTLRGGRGYRAYVSAMIPAGRVGDVLKLSQFRFRSSFGEFEVVVSEVEVYSLESLDRPLGELFRVRFLTPTILSNKVMLPPTLRRRARVPSMHKLLPSASYVMCYLAQLWNANVPPELGVPKPGSGEWACYKVGRLADVTMVEVDYRLHPVTVAYGRRGGRLRRIRGVRGWVLYRLLEPRFKHIFSRLLALGELMGVGRSRGIGMGQMRVELVEPRELGDA